MQITNDLRDLLASSVTWYPLASRDAYGAPTYGTGTEYAARVVRKHRLVRDGTGDEVVSTARAWLAGTPAIAPDDRVVLEDATAPPIVAVERYDDEAGASHTVVFFR